jgi:hypothetical protein
MEDGGWQRPERCQGNDCQRNNPENALFHSLDKHSPDFGFCPYGGPGNFSDMRGADGLKRKDRKENQQHKLLSMCALRSFAAKMLSNNRDFSELRRRAGGLPGLHR